MKNIITTVVSVILIGCIPPTGIVLQNYTDPLEYNVPQFITVSQSKEDVWNKLINGLGKSFFVINNIEKNSGFLNLSYTGNPEMYVDGGILSQIVKRSGRKDEIFEFNAAKESITLIEQDKRRVLYQRVRSMSLDGRINVIVTSVDSNTTQITVNVKYILSHQSKNYTMENIFFSDQNENISFNSGQIGTSKAGTKYRSNGVLERTIYELTN